MRSRIRRVRSAACGFIRSAARPTAILSSADPVFGATISVDAGNSSGVATAGILVAGLAAASIPTTAGGTPPVDPALLTFVSIPAGGVSFSGTIPLDPGLCGLSVYLQLLELDPGASRGISFTPGLELAIGH